MITDCCRICPVDVLSRADDVDVLLPDHDQHPGFNEKILLIPVGCCWRIRTVGFYRNG
jgi:hypothetical protein